MEFQVLWKYAEPGPNNSEVISLHKDGPEVLCEQSITKSSKTIHQSYHRLLKYGEFQNDDKTFLKFDRAIGAFRILQQN